MLSENLRLFRKNFKLTQQEVADILGIDRSTYTFYETGKTTPSNDNIKKLCDIYNVTMGHLCGWEKNCTELKISNKEELKTEAIDGFDKISKNEKFLLMAYRSLPNEKKDEFLNNLKDFLKN